MAWPPGRGNRGEMHKSIAPARRHRGVRCGTEQVHQEDPPSKSMQHHLYQRRKISNSTRRFDEHSVCGDFWSSLVHIGQHRRSNRVKQANLSALRASICLIDRTGDIWTENDEGCYSTWGNSGEMQKHKKMRWGHVFNICVLTTLGNELVPLR